MVDSEDIFRRSKRELRGAAAAIQAMRDAKDFDAYALAWQTFLDKLEKVWVKAERECQHIRNRFEPWQAAFKELRKTDPVLRYLHQARHADQHSIQPTACESLFGFRMEIPPGGTVDVEIDKEKGQLRVHGACQIKAVSGSRHMLVPITNRGTQYNPPEEHLGQKLEDNSPPCVAEKGLAFYEDFLLQAEAKFFPPAARGDVDGERHADLPC
jgi:hypothetical protein